METHLGQLILYFNEQKTTLDDFEKVSSFIKRHTFMIKKSEILIPQEPAAWRQLSQKLLATKPKILPLISDVLQDMQILHWAGVGFSEEDVLRLQLSLSNLQDCVRCKDLRFWGKFMTSGQDYWVAEGKIQSIYKNDQEESKENEPKGTGVNSYTYWVTNSLLRPWIELPDVTVEQLNVARKVRKILTGNLDADVFTYPLFPGKERHFLRAQIARISHATVIAPKGYYKLQEENENEIEVEEEIQLPEDVGNAENWQHVFAMILKANRINHIEIEDEEALAKLQEEDPPQGRLREISTDDPVPGFEIAWTIRIEGDKQVYGETSYAVTVLKSLRWPGSLCAFQNNRWVNIYIGYGLKSFQDSFTPIDSPDIGQEPVDLREQYEPNPKEAPAEQVESDTDNPFEVKEDEEEES